MVNIIKSTEFMKIENKYTTNSYYIFTVNNLLCFAF